MGAMDLSSELIERLAQAVHANYRDRQQRVGVAVSPWSDLDEDTRDANRGQARGIPDKLRSIGCAIVPTPAVDFAFTGPEIELLARAEHERWCTERTTAGWTHAAKRDNSAKLHPSLVAWDQLGPDDQDKDRDTVRDIPAVLAQAGLGIARAR
jgi:hypothetical protein